MCRKTFIIAALSLGLVSCVEAVQSGSGAEGGIELSVTEINLDATGTADTDLAVTSGGSWTASVSAPWLTFDPTSGGAGETVVTVSGKPNDAVTSRSVDVLIFSDSESKIVRVTQSPRAVEFSCHVSATSVNFDHAYDYEPYDLSVETGEDPVELDLTEAPWLEAKGGKFTVPSNSKMTLTLCPKEPNYSHNPRTSIIRLTGRQTSQSVDVTVSQPASFQNEAESLHNLWRHTSNASSQSSWRNDMMLTANYGDKKGILSIESSINSDVDIMADDNRCTFKGMHAMDAILLRTPVKYIAAGTDVSAMLCLAQKTALAPRKWVVEYWDDEKWNEIRTFMTCNESTDYECSTVICDFTLSKPVENDYVKLRFRMLTNDASVINFMPASPWYGAALIINSGAPAIKDSKKILIYGNSFTYYWGSAFILKQLARSQGYRLDVRAHMDPSVPLITHARALSISKALAKEGGYDFALLQEQSTVHAEYADGKKTSALSEAQLLAGEIRAASPSCRIILENTWAYSKSSYMGYGSFSGFDEKLRKGCEEIAEGIQADISPINQAFAAARSSCPELKLLHTDGHHPSVYGTYLKSCVNYLTIFEGQFNGEPYLWELSEENVSKLIREAEKIQ